MLKQKIITVCDICESQNIEGIQEIITECKDFGEVSDSIRICINCLNKKKY